MNMMSMSSITCMIIPTLLIIISKLTFTRSNKDREKMSPFECGFDPMNSARIPFSTRFFLLAVIFIVFDIEIVLLMPIPMILLLSNNMFMIMASTTFILILFLGLIHEWFQGSLNWSS